MYCKLYYCNIAGVLATEITSVIELPNITSIQVTWNQPEGGLAVDEYVLSYHQGQENVTIGQSSSFPQQENVTLRANTNTAVLHLEANKSYAVFVTGRKGALYNTSDTLWFMTNSTATVASSSSSVAVGVGVLVVVLIIIATVAVVFTVIPLLYYRYTAFLWSFTFLLFTK